MYLYKLCVNELEELDFKKERGGLQPVGRLASNRTNFPFFTICQTSE